MTESSVKNLGVVYTPKHVVELILDNILPVSNRKLVEIKLCDPACGDGAFLTAFTQRVLTTLEQNSAVSVLKNLSGYDIDEEAITECRKRLDELLEQYYPLEKIDWNISSRNALDRSQFEGETGTFNAIVGNPPYVRVQNLEQVGRNKLLNQWGLLRGATDLYIVFFELALSLLSPGGKLGYITPSSWIKSDAGKHLRGHLVNKHKVIKLFDFGYNQVFEGVTTYTTVTIIKKGGITKRIPVKSAYDTDNKNEGFVVVSDDPSDPWWIAKKREDLNRMKKLVGNGIPLKEIADIHVGLQTLADSVFILPFEQAHSLKLEEWMLRRIVKASVMKDGKDPQRRVVIFPYDKKGRLYSESMVEAKAPNIYRWLLSHKNKLMMRDKGHTDPEKWYGFGRNVSIISGFGDKILTSGMNERPNFQKCPYKSATFYSGYCIKLKEHATVSLDDLLVSLNSDDMDFFIKSTSRQYQGGWMSYAKSFIEKYPVVVK